MKKVAVIHTTPVTIPTLKKLLTDNRRPDEEEIEVINFLDDSMLPEINRLGHPSEGVGTPVSRIDEPMARLAAGYSRIGVAATLHSTIMPTTELIRRKAAIAGKEISIQSTVIENVGNLLAENKGDLYDEMVGEQLRLLLEENEVVVLAQASMARAVERWPEEEKSRCLTSPVSGVEAVRDYLRKKEG